MNGLLVVEPDHEAQRHLVVGEVVEEAAAEGLVLHRPAGGVHHEARLGAGRVDFPQLLDADGVGLRILAGVQLVAGDQLLAQVAARAFGEHGVLADQLHAELERAGGLAVLADAHVAGGHATHGALFVVQHLGRGEAGEDLHAQAFRLLRQPAHHVAQRHDIAAVVVEVARHQPVGCARAAGLGQEQHVVAGDRLRERRAQRLPVGDEFGDRARIHHGARQDVRARLRAFLDHDHRQLGVQLLQVDRGGQAGRTGADHHHVVFHGLTRAELRYQFLGVHVRKARASALGQRSDLRLRHRRGAIRRHAALVDHQGALEGAHHHAVLVEAFGGHRHDAQVGA